MPKPCDYQGVVSLYNRGILTDLHAVGLLIDLAGHSDVGELVSSLPPELLAQVRQSVAESPSTDHEWDRTFSIFGGTYKRDPDYDPAKEQARLRAVYRVGIEALRRHFEEETRDA
jgi:hypothetical protein